MRRKIYTYDVSQRAWEQEPNGFEANTQHVLTHLAKTLWLKDFKDPETVRSEIAPDSVQYALRIARWGRLSPVWLMVKVTPYARAERAVREKGMDMPVSQATFIEGTAHLAEHLHDLGHKSERSKALLHESRQFAVIGSAATLLASAQYQAEEYDFDLVEAFDDRLTTLRERFDIPEPIEQS